MSLSRKHFVDLAEIVGSIRDDRIRDDMRVELSRFCRGHNDRFDSNRFDAYVKRLVQERRDRDEVKHKRSWRRIVASEYGITYLGGSRI